MQLLIVNYHYFREVKYDNGIYPVSASEFELHLEYLNENYKLISQAELASILCSKKKYNDKFAMVTFDDGLSEQMSAYDILIKKGMPGVFYINTNPIKNNRCEYVHKLHYVRSIVDDSVLYDELVEMYEINKYAFNNQTLRSQYKYDSVLSQKVKYFINFVLNNQQRGKFISNFFSRVVHNESDFAKKLYMSNQDILDLYQSDMLGTHSASHIALAQLSNDEIRREIRLSKDHLYSVGVNDIVSISYPYGGPTAADSRVAGVANEFNFAFGLSMFAGVNSAEDIFNNRMLLKRISCSDLVIR